MEGHHHVPTKIPDAVDGEVIVAPIPTLKVTARKHVHCVNCSIEFSWKKISS